MKKCGFPPPRKVFFLSNQNPSAIPSKSLISGIGKKLTKNPLHGGFFNWLMMGNLRAKLFKEIIPDKLGGVIHIASQIGLVKRKVIRCIYKLCLIKNSQMEIKELKKRPSIEQNKKLIGNYAQFDKLLTELKKKKLPKEIVNSINNGIDQINSVSESEKELGKQIRESQSSILKLIEKELKIVTKNHYRNTWLAVGMAVFGIPLGVAFGASLGNMAFLGIGLPIGMAIGIAVGSGMDKKAFEEGRQIDLEIKY